MTALDNLRGMLQSRYLRWELLENGERVLQAMAILADVVRVRESGTNRGYWVESFLAKCGLGPGYPWCAAALSFACDAVDVPRPAKGGASCAMWRAWARDQKKLVTEPKRGRACVKDYGQGKGHIGIVVRTVGPLVWSLEGNTGPGEAGSQRDGDGLYRRVRSRRFWDHYIEL